MGLPLTWITLSLFHIYCVSKADQRYHALRKSRLTNAQDRHTAYGRLAYRICGDDLIALWPPAMIKQYEEVMIEHGAKFSVGKHYVSEKYGVFTEIIFQCKATEIKYIRKIRRHVKQPVIGSKQWQEGLEWEDELEK